MKEQIRSPQLPHSEHTPTVLLLADLALASPVLQDACSSLGTGLPQGLGVSCFLPGKQQDPIPPPFRPLLNVTLLVNSFLRKGLKSTYQPCSQHSPDRIYQSGARHGPLTTNVTMLLLFLYLERNLPEAEDMYLFCSFVSLEYRGFHRCAFSW